MDKGLWRNRLGFGLGTVGRDAVAAMVSMYLMYYMTEVLDVSGETLVMVTGVIVFMRVFDGLNDPFMGTLVDNTRSRWGKFKPWILGGAVTWAIFHVLMFWDTGLRGVPFVIVFTLVYIAWEISYTANDISYWSMIPALSRSQKEREKIGSVARICASVGMFALVVAILPVTNALGERFGSLQKGWFALAFIVSGLMLLFQSFTLLLAKAAYDTSAPRQETRFRDIFRIIFQNDQLLIVSVAMLFFMTGYTLTTSLGIYYFKYIFGDEGMYSIFALVLGISQIIGLAIFPLLAAKLPRKKMLGMGIGLVVIGYVLFYLSPKHMLPIGLAGVFLFVGQAFIQLLMLLYIADSVEYGEWKFKQRNESVTFSLQPLIYKVSNALANLLLGVTLFVSGIADASADTSLTSREQNFFKIFMLVLPAIFVVISYAIMGTRYKIDETFYKKIVKENLEEEESRANR